MNIKKQVRKVDFLILLLVGIGFSCWAFIEKEFFGSVILLLSFVVFTRTRWRWVYKNNTFNISTTEEKSQARECLNQRVLYHLKWRTYLVIYLLIAPIILVISNYFGLALRDNFVIFGMILIYMVTLLLTSILKLKK